MQISDVIQKSRSTIEQNRALVEQTRALVGETRRTINESRAITYGSLPDSSVGKPINHDPMSHRDAYIAKVELQQSMHLMKTCGLI